MRLAGMHRPQQQDCLWLRGALGERELAALDRMAVGPGRPGARITAIAAETVAVLMALSKLIAGHALPDARLVRVVMFTKDGRANWAVPWHQDRIIAVADRHDLPGFVNWSLKFGVGHCEPPATVLEQMRFVRVHLDDCGEDNGAMEIACGSHVRGVVAGEDAADIAARFPKVVCTARSGDVQILPMLTLHRSPAARLPAPRRAIRLDFAAADLPEPLRWARVLP